jgi:hypothetical protein
MGTSLERRLRRLEIASRTNGGIEIWIDQGDGTVRGLGGEQMTRQEVIERARMTGATAIFIDEIDAQL